MSDVGFVVAGYVTVVGGLALYALLLIRRGRRLSRRVPAEERRWL
jgi:hypothetical protein